MQDRRFLEAVAKLRSDLPESLATQLAAHTAAVNAAVGPVQDARQFDSPVQTDIIAQVGLLLSTSHDTCVHSCF